MRDESKRLKLRHEHDSLARAQTTQLSGVNRES
jgi:hypothetical protein